MKRLVVHKDTTLSEPSKLLRTSKNVVNYRIIEYKDVLCTEKGSLGILGALPNFLPNFLHARVVGVRSAFLPQTAVSYTPSREWCLSPIVDYM